MDMLELIRNADSVAELLSALSVYVNSLHDAPIIPEWCLRLPLEGERDVFRRMMAMVAVVNLEWYRSGGERVVAEQILQHFAAAAWRLMRR